MAKKARRRKHVPYRTCVACRTSRPKRDLIRIVRTPDDRVIVDERGKENGRGAYLCAQRVCWTEALKRRHLSRALRVDLSSEAVDALQRYAERLPEVLQEPDEGEGET